MDEPGQIGAAWDRALGADRPTLLDVRTDPDVPPIPPHATFEQMRDTAAAMIAGDASRWGVLREGVLSGSRRLRGGESWQRGARRPAPPDYPGPGSPGSTA